MIAFVFGFGLLLLLVAVITMRAQSSVAPNAPSGTDVFELSARYRPMLRLLDGPDFELLNEAGDRRLMRRIRSERRSIFRGYLRGLRRDHSIICSKVRQLTLASAADRGDLAAAVFRSELSFRILMGVIEVKLLLHAAGMRSVTATPLVEALERMTSQAKLVSSQAALTA